MKINWNKWMRKGHYWIAIAIALPILIVLGSGLLLQVKKEVTWIQPKTMRGEGDVPELTFEDILSAASTVREAQISGWPDVDRLDVRPKKGVIKIRSKNRYEIQIDHQTAEVLQVAYRRSDVIEQIHDGSFFHDKAKLWIFLPSGFLLFVLWVTGIYLFALPLVVKRRKRKKLKLPSRNRGHVTLPKTSYQPSGLNGSIGGTARRQ
ncbi:MAG: PepSY domain-containing protein [Candidatus Eisenbacteria bacterium]|uniref:PepSY domain-containing protein n=1 Tax=Eiseniibacteriota bacterium TaxID=2212470 RepID=A0A7Y2H2G3_UNCEI|nr:PepSY domain-containing protein [Candidatus Eisenbacteria bacterium]